MELLANQQIIRDQPVESKIFLEGLAGSGKTTTGVIRLQKLLDSGISGSSILILVPQRSLAEPYRAIIRSPVFGAGGAVSILTFGGLARRCIHLFWPLIAKDAGFEKPNGNPIFLTLETAQYYMAHLVRPLLDEGYFESVTINRNRLFSQIIDNLNKSALVGFDHNQIGERLKSSCMGDVAQLHIYEEAQRCASLFRNYCLKNNLLDFSLQIEIFMRWLWPLPLFHTYLVHKYQHLIYDNLEEDHPAAHDMVGEWLEEVDSALLIFDWDAGYRRFLGADPISGYRLKSQCDTSYIFDESLIQSAAMRKKSFALANSIMPPEKRKAGVNDLRGYRGTGQETTLLPSNPQAILINSQRFFPQMLDWMADQIASLVKDQQIPPDEIVVLAPFLSDALRFSIANRMKNLEIPLRTHRPSRSLHEEPATQCLFTLAKFTYLDWGFNPSKDDMVHALLGAIDDLDLIRAWLLTEIVFRERNGIPVMTSFDQIRPQMQERITYRLGERFEKIRLWLEAAREDPGELDHFLSRLFGEILSQPGFGFHNNLDFAEVAANLIESVQKFRWAVGERLKAEKIPVGKEFLDMVQQGVIAAQYMRSWRTGQEKAVLLAPAHTFLMSNRPVQVQFWLDIGSRGWSERLFQPLTQPYVLSRNWEEGRKWTDSDEVNHEQEALYRLILGLTRRCREQIYVGFSDLSEHGYEQRGQLLKALERALR